MIARIASWYAPNPSEDIHELTDKRMIRREKFLVVARC